MKIKIDGYEICISARSTVVEDDPFTDDRAAEVINFVICNLNTLSDFCKASTDEVYKQFAKVVKSHSNELYVQLDERGYYEKYRKNKSNA